jgi:membrane fusion protein (multidrug efflux system)
MGIGSSKMPAEKRQSADKGTSSSVAANPTDTANVTARDTDKARGDVSSEPNAPISHQPIRRRHLLLGVAAVLLLAVVLVFGIPWIRQTLNTVSTDDAYVNGHVTFVAARVPGQVSKVLVDDNYRVKKGDLLVQLDKEPYEVAVAIKKLLTSNEQFDRLTRARVRRSNCSFTAPRNSVCVWDRGRDGW